MALSYKSESAFQKEVKRFLEKDIGGRVTINTPAMHEGISYSEKGLPDITGCLPGGYFIAAEVKKAKGSAVSVEQRNYLVSLRMYTPLAWIVYPENYEEFKQAVHSVVQGRKVAPAGLYLTAATKAKRVAHHIHTFLQSMGGSHE